MGDGFNLTPEGKRIFRELDKLGEMVVKVGFQHGKASEDTGIDICDVAPFNELGTERSPSRPFMRDSVYDNEDMIRAFLQSKVVDIIQKGESASQALKGIGVFQKSLIQDTIEEGHFEPNAGITVNGGWMRTKDGKPFYVKGKHSTHPLIDTGTMKNSVNFVIKKKG